MTTIIATQTVPKIPVVDFSREDCFKAGSSSWLSVRAEVCRALEEFSCFVVVMPNKVSPELHDTFFGSIGELFDFPVEIKSQTPQEMPRLDGHHVGPFNESLVTGTDTERWHQFEHHFWPSGNDQYRESADLYMKVMTDLNQVVTRMVFENYNAEKYHDDHIQSTIYSLRFTKYKELKEVEMGMEKFAHTDANFSTILHQNHVNGLEIHTKDDKWIEFDPQLPSSFIFMACDGFQVWSNDRIRSCKHRVIIKQNSVRFSVGLFCYIEGLTTIPKEFIDKDHPIQYKPFHQLDYLKYFLEQYSTSSGFYQGVLRGLIFMDERLHFLLVIAAQLRTMLF